MGRKTGVLRRRHLRHTDAAKKMSGKVWERIGRMRVQNAKRRETTELLPPMLGRGESKSTLSCFAMNRAGERRLGGKGEQKKEAKGDG